MLVDAWWLIKAVAVTSNKSDRQSVRNTLQAKKERLEEWQAVLADASRRAENLALAFEDAGARTGDVGMSLIRLGRFQVASAVVRDIKMPGPVCCGGSNRWSDARFSRWHRWVESAAPGA